MSDLIVKANNLIEGFTDMTQNEYKLTLLVISKINRNDKEFRKQTVSAEEYAELLNTPQDGVYTQMIAMQKSLPKRTITIKYNNGDIITIPWFGYAKYIKGKSCLEIAFNHDLAPYLLQIDIPYTKYLLSNINRLNSNYAIRIFEILKQYQNIGYRILSIDEIKKMVSANSASYNAYNNLKRKVIIKAQEELRNSNNTDIYFEFEEIKEVRKVVAIKFLIKTKPKEDKPVPEKFRKGTTPEIEAIITTFRLKTGAELHASGVAGLIKAKGIDKVNYYLENYQKFIDTQNINSLPKFFHTVVMGDIPVPDTKSKKSNKRIPQKENYEQRKYDNEFYESLYENVKPKKSV